MQKIRLLSPLLIAGLSLVLSFSQTSCKQGEKQCSTCRVLPENGKAKMAINGNTYELPYWEAAEPGKQTYRTGRGFVKGDQLRGIIKWLDLPKEQAPANVVLFTSKFHKDGEQVDKADILGCQYYYVVNRTLMHRFYYMHDGRMVNVGSLTGESNGINYNNRADLAEIYFSSYKTVFAFGLGDSSVEFGECKRNEVSAAIAYMKKKMGAGLRPPPGGDGVICKIPCADKNATRECDDDNKPYPPSCDFKHEPSDEPMQAMKDASVTNGHQSEQDADITFNFPLQYLLRDSVLSRYAFGRKYTEWYYDLTGSAYVSDQIVLQTILVLNSFNVKINGMLDYDNHLQDVLIDPTLKTETAKLLDLMEAAAPNATEKTIFVDARKDLNTYAGMTYQQFFTAIH